MSKINVLTYTAIRECRVLKNGMYPVSLIVYYNGVKKRYRTGLEVSKNDWTKIKSLKLRDDDLKEKRNDIQDIIKKADKAGKKLHEFSFEAFETEYFSKKDMVIEEMTFEECTREFLKEKRSDLSYKTRLMYETMLNSVNKFRPNLKLRSLSQDLIRRYEETLKSDKKSVSTVGIYLRQVRAICNFAIKKKYMTHEKYPFAEFVVPAAGKNKRALNNTLIKALIRYKSTTPEKQKATDFWTFSFLGNGMNFNDIARLKYSNISGEYLRYYRNKTKNTSKGDQKEINVYLQPRMNRIIKKWGNKMSSKDDYVFPIMNEKLKEKAQHDAIAQFIKTTNKYLKEVSKEKEWTEHITTYHARHSFATILKRNGSSVAFISEALGHGNIKTTENYLSSFTDEEVKENAKLLLKL